MLSSAGLAVRLIMEGMAVSSKLGEDLDIHVLQACCPLPPGGDAEGPEGPGPAGKQGRNNGFVFRCIRHAFCLVEKAEQERGKIYDVVLRVRYDLTFEEFFWTEAGAKSHFAYGSFRHRWESRVTGK